MGAISRTFKCRTLAQQAVGRDYIQHPLARLAGSEGRYLIAVHDQPERSRSGKIFNRREHGYAVDIAEDGEEALYKASIASVKRPKRNRKGGSHKIQPGCCEGFQFLDNLLASTAEYAKWSLKLH
jgi:hypothetical protein